VLFLYGTASDTKNIRKSILQPQNLYGVRKSHAEGTCGNWYFILLSQPTQPIILVHHRQL
jgi:hypothetical protein